MLKLLISSWKRQGNRLVLWKSGLNSLMRVKIHSSGKLMNSRTSLLNLNRKASWSIQMLLVIFIILINKNNKNTLVR